MMRDRKMCPGAKPDLQDLLDDIAVSDPYERDYAIQTGNNTWPEGWWAVHTGEDSIIGYFLNERDAFRFRLDLINRRLNP
jgi:hypothetical protein